MSARRHFAATLKTMVSPAAWAVILVLSAGCQTPRSTPPASTEADASRDATADSESAVRLRTDAERYAPGAKLILTLENRSDARWAFNACSRVVERDDSGTWRAIEEPGRVCTMIAMLLEPHGSTTASTELPTAIAPGRYRVVLEMFREVPPPASERIRAASQAFTVER